MASPQREAGYTALANEILEAMARIKMSPMQYRLLFVVWRYTYGFQRKEADLSLTFLANATGCDKRQIQRELKDLNQRKIIIQNTEKQSRVIGFNKDYDQWLDDIPVNKEGIGETTNGEIDNGDLTNGESVEGGIGEVTNPPIGEFTNQERKSLNKSFKENNNNDNNARAQPNFITTYEQEFGRLISPTELETLQSFVNDGMSEEVVCEAIKRTRLHGKTNLSYTKTILNDWNGQGVRNMAGVARVDLEFEQRKKPGQAKTRGDPSPRISRAMQSILEVPDSD